jgi:hypothetical protein
MITALSGTGRLRNTAINRMNDSTPAAATKPQVRPTFRSGVFCCPRCFYRLAREWAAQRGGLRVFGPTVAGRAGAAVRNAGRGGGALA